jgi:thiosulfate/3-mercaptopyruvate sulfurtransferase
MLVQSDWLATHLKDRNLVVLHVGTDRSAYEAQHIPGARFLPLTAIAVTRNGLPNELPPVNELKSAFQTLGISNQSRVILYGERLGLLAARAYFALDYLGLGSRAALLDGGLEKWTAERRPTSRGTEAVNKPGVLTVSPRADLLVNLPAVQRIVATKSRVLIDARPPADYSGAAGGERTGHIPGAKNVYWMDNLVSPSNPALKPLSDIAAKYKAAGVKPGSNVVVYCQTGIQAAHDYFTLKLAGFKPVLYDGSFIEWSAAFGTPVEKGKSR